MTQLFQSERVPARTRGEAVVTAVCIVAVATAVLFHRRTGACGTGHYVFFQLLGGMVMSVLNDVWHFRYAGRAAQGLAYVLNVGVFVLLLYLWHRRASRRYALGVLAITAAYLCSYFFLLPTVDCP